MCKFADRNDKQSDREFYVFHCESKRRFAYVFTHENNNNKRQKKNG